MAWSQESSFGFGVPSGFFNKENVVHLFGSIDQPKLQLTLAANYFLLTNYPYFYNYYIAAQETNPFNVLIISAKKVCPDQAFNIKGAGVFTKVAGGSPVNIPLFVTHGQIGYEGKLD
jgi:hypothetical protein